jgi:hypothetical protein
MWGVNSQPPISVVHITIHLDMTVEGSSQGREVDCQLGLEPHGSVGLRLCHDSTDELGQSIVLLSKVKPT